VVNLGKKALVPLFMLPLYCTYKMT